MPELSFIIPVYNAEEYLPAALDSLKRQTFPDWEAILVDDGSPDGSGALCDAATQADPRFRVIHQKNAGVGAARNAGLDAAKGTYVHFLDADDSLEPEMAQCTLEAARRENADLVLFGSWEDQYDAAGRKQSSRAIPPPISGVHRGDPCVELLPQLAAFYFVTRQLFRRSLLEHCRFTKHSIGEDALFFISAYRKRPGCVVGVDEPLYHYSVRPNGSASQSYHPERLEDNFYLSDAVAGVVQQWGTEDLPEHRAVVNKCRVLDLQLGIKNVCLSPLSFARRTAWLRTALQRPEVRAAVAEMPLNAAGSRNDRIKLSLLKAHLCGAVIALSSLNNRK
mgnify:CR=1 FL=1